MRTQKCTICGNRYLKHAMNCHITGQARVEAMREMCMLINTSRMKPCTFSPLILMKHCPHWKYLRSKPKRERSMYDLK